MLNKITPCDSGLAMSSTIRALKGMRVVHRLGEDIDILMEGVNIYQGCAQATQEGEGLVVHVDGQIGLLQRLARGQVFHHSAIVYHERGIEL